MDIHVIMRIVCLCQYCPYRVHAVVRSSTWGLDHMSPLSRLTVLQATERREGPGNEATPSPLSADKLLGQCEARSSLLDHD